MGKLRKTREQKIISDLRRKLETIPQSTTMLPVSRLPASLPLATQDIPLKRYTPVSSFIFSDLKKTALVTVTLLVAEIILSVVINR